MAWWSRKNGPPEVVTAAWMGEKLTEVFDPSGTLRMVMEAHPTLSDEDAAFLAVAALRLVGFHLAVMQKSIRTRIERPVTERIYQSYVGTLIMKYAESCSHPCDSTGLGSRLLALAKKTYNTFMDNRERAQSAGLHPVWFAGKEVCTFLTGDPDRINPEEVMLHAQFLHDTIIGTKKLFDELLDKGVTFAL